MSTNNDLAVITAIAESNAPVVLTEEQRAESLQAIELFRELSSHFLDSAEAIITGGQPCEGLRNACTTGSRISTANHKILKALWALEAIEREQRWHGIAVMGKEEV